MYDSDISAKDLINEVRSEVDVALPVPNASYVTWLNSLEQFLYSSIIKEQHSIKVTNPPNIIFLPTLGIGSDEAPVRFDDIYTVYADTEQLIKTNKASSTVFGGCYYRDNDNLGIVPHKTVSELNIIYYIKPALKTVDSGDNVSGEHVMLPIEFIEIAKSKLRAEAYMIENEYVPAANWMNNYNALLENFKQWLAERAAQFGM